MSRIKFTVLGNSGAYPTEESACSGYLVETQKTKILLDCGSGVYQKLIQKIDLKDLDAIVLSHLHSDHMSDVLVLRYALQMKGLPRLKLFMPEKPEAESYILKNSPQFDVEIIKGNQEYHLGDVMMAFARMKHSVASYAAKIRTDKSFIVYTGDTEYTPVLGEFAKWCDLLVCDAAFSQKTYRKGAPHASAVQAGKMAAEAGAAKLMLTHFMPGAILNDYLTDAKGEFKHTILSKSDLTINV